MWFVIMRPPRTGVSQADAIYLLGFLPKDASTSRLAADLLRLSTLNIVAILGLVDPGHIHISSTPHDATGSILGTYQLFPGMLMPLASAMR